MSAPAVPAPREEVVGRRTTTTDGHVLAPTEPCPVGFVAGLRAHGDRTAVVADGVELTYRELADRVDRVAEELGTTRRLVLVEAASDLSTLVGYLGALRGGHVAVMVARDDDAQRADLTARFDPDAVIGPDGRVRPRRAGSRHDLHPDLALLMTTSGSTGRPRLVRLPAPALDANATAIAEYLEIEPTDRAAVMLPLHYCYGLSVVHSNLLRGAALVLTDRSVADPRFWTAFHEQRATSLHGVPYTFELLDQVDFATLSQSLPHLRYVTQAGGRLAPDQVRRWARIGRRDGWRLVVMYGQTEATARMAYLPPDRAENAAGAIGRPIPGGSFALEPVDGSGPGVGEVVYRGPNVMLGYATAPADLALGRSVHELRTGDLGRRRPDGLYEIVGRRSRFLKPFGIRIDLDGLETMLDEHDLRAACTGTDEQLVVAVEGTGSSAEERVRALVTDRLHLPAHALTVVVVGELPRRPNGKLDHPAVAALATRPAPDSRRWWARRRPRTVREVFARTFGETALSDDASFVDLGGDSLTYVQVAGQIEQALGRLPHGWDRMPLGELDALAPRRSRLATLESAVVLRALAVVFVIGDHAHLWTLLGGAHLLLAVSGWTFARFVLAERGSADTSTPITDTSVSRRILRSTARIAIPSALWILYRAVVHNVRFVDALLVGSLLPPIVRGYWYIDALVQTLVLLSMLFAVPLVRRLDRRFPFGLPAALLAVALVGRLFPVGYADWFTIDIYSTQVVAWLFLLGWMIQRVRTHAQTWVALAAVLVLVPTFFGTDLERSVIVTAGAVVLLLVPRIALPRTLAQPVTTVASASLGIFLTHFALLPLENVGVPAWVLVPMAVVVGIVSWWLVTTAGRALARWRVARRSDIPASESTAPTNLSRSSGAYPTGRRADRDERVAA